MKPKSAKSASKKPAKPAARKSPLTIPPLLALVCRALEDKKAGDVRVLHVGPHSSITDFLVVATGTSEPHLRALRVELEKVIDATGTRILGMDTGETGSGWLVIDAFDVMIHVLTQESREHYSLEKLWKDAEDISLPVIFGEAKPATAKKAPAKKAPAKKAPTKKAPAAAAKKPKAARAKPATKPAKKKTGKK